MGDLGPFFATSAWSPDAGWRSLLELTGSDAAMRERVEAATATLAAMAGVTPGDLEPRTVASTVTLGLLARLVSPPLATAVLDGRVPRWSPERLWWQPVPGGPWPLAVGDASWVDVGDDLDRAASAFSQHVVEALLHPVLARVGADYALSAQVLWGNAASALVGARTMLDAAVPAAAGTTYAVVGRVLEQGRLAGTGTLTRTGFVRRSCCLFYRIPDAGTCGDCVLGDRVRPAR